MFKSLFFRDKSKIEYLKDEYLEQAVDLIKQHPVFLWGNDKKIYREEFLRFLLNPLSNKLKVFTIEKEGKLLGVVSVSLMEDSQSYYEIDLVVVDKDFQGKGYGTKLLKEVFRRVKKLGGKHLYLLTSNEHYNKRAQKFYKRLKFEKAGVLPDYYVDKYSNRVDDTTIYIRKL